jgi:hypothetical protein
MQTIFVQIKCDLGKSYRVAEAAVDEVEGISEVHSTSGQYAIPPQELTCLRKFQAARAA